MDLVAGPTRHRYAARSQGFTLIELLVVMIILAVLMAVAVPTFLMQKTTALKTQTIQSIDLISKAAESCSVAQAGAYTTCLEHQALTDYEPSLAGTMDVWTTGNRRHGEFDIDGIYQGKVVKAPNQTTAYQGYIIASWMQDGDKKIFFSLAHTETGAVIKACGEGDTNTAAPSGGAPHPGAPVLGSRVCTSGHW